MISLVLVLAGCKSTPPPRQPVVAGPSHVAWTEDQWDVVPLGDVDGDGREEFLQRLGGHGTRYGIRDRDSLGPGPHEGVLAHCGVLLGTSDFDADGAPELVFLSDKRIELRRGKTCTCPPLASLAKDGEYLGFAGDTDGDGVGEFAFQKGSNVRIVAPGNALVDEFSSGQYQLKFAGAMDLDGDGAADDWVVLGLARNDVTTGERDYELHVATNGRVDTVRLPTL